MIADRMEFELFSRRAIEFSFLAFRNCKGDEWLL
jgi:hypothetical protein